ncbi:MAG: hypothetical protein L0Y56_01830, partial [Nitrospira sp.]|nr:hypothetical protein [Nitrospira sp.]
MNKLSCFLVGIISLVITLPATVFAQVEKPPLPETLPRALEVELALSAIPEHLRKEATVYVLERGGYVKAQEGTNGFSCLVRRNGVMPFNFYGAIIPLCYDAEGSATLLPVDLDEAKLLEEGLSFDEAHHKINAG